MRRVCLLVLLVSFYGCYTIKKTQLCTESNKNSDFIYLPLSDSLKAFFTKKEIKEFNRGYKLFMNKAGVQDRTYYELLNDGTKQISSQGYYYIDAQVGSGKDYYKNGKISLEWNFVIYNDSLKKTMDLNGFNRLCKRKGNGFATGYHNYRNGTWKYYSKDGKLTKEEIYDKGKLEKTIKY